MRRGGLAALWLLAVGAPLWLGDRPYLVTVLNQVAVFGLWAVAYNLVYGQLGEISFGHAAFFGLGAYTVALAGRDLDAAFLPAVLLGALVAAAAAAVIAVIIRQARGVFYAIMTFAFAQVMYFLAMKWTSFTGGDDGMSVVRPGWLATPGRYYVFSVVVVTAALLAIRRMVASPGGHVVRAIGQNERRARQVGYNTGVYRGLTFVVSGCFSGLAGALFSPLIFFVSPNVLHWSFSGEVIVMTIIGGAGTFLGPVLGAAFFVIVQEAVSGLTGSDLVIFGLAVGQLGDRWPLVMGLLFFLAVVFAPDGLAGRLSRRGRRAAGPAEGRAGLARMAVPSNGTLKGGST